MKTNRVQIEFDLKAGDYESSRLAPWYKAHAEEILKHCPPLEGGNVLDIGCATGHQLRLLSLDNPDSTLIGIDVAPKMIKQANEQSLSLDQFQFIDDDWENLSAQNLNFLRQFKFKLIVCANTFHYFSDPETSCRRMIEMLAPNGLLLILDREKSSSALTQVWGFFHKYFIKDQVKFYTAQDISLLLKQAGSSNTQVISTIKKYFWKGKLFTSIALIKGEK